MSSAECLVLGELLTVGLDAGLRPSARVDVRPDKDGDVRPSAAVAGCYRPLRWHLVAKATLGGTKYDGRP